MPHAPGPSTIDAIVYDFGGVIVNIDFDWVFQRWAELGNVPMEQVKRGFTHGSAYQRHERGEIDLAEYYRELRKEIGAELTDAQLVDGWQRVFGPEVPQVVARVKELAPRVPQYLFSNTNLTHYDYFRVRYAQALAPFTRVFVSHEMRLRKPEREAFAWISREIGVPFERMLFFDDTVANVEGAHSLGIQSILVRRPEDVLEALRSWDC
jgi:FMN phosphatase YigB (HAD superfamily)